MNYQEKYCNENQETGQNNIIKTLNINVKGRVQGVGFRYRTLILAKKLGVKGTVCNQTDYSVNIIAEANTSTLNKFIEALKNENANIKIETLTIQETKTKNFKDFSIIY